MLCVSDENIYCSSATTDTTCTIQCDSSESGTDCINNNIYCSSPTHTCNECIILCEFGNFCDNVTIFGNQCNKLIIIESKFKQMDDMNTRDINNNFGIENITIHAPTNNYNENGLLILNSTSITISTIIGNSKTSIVFNCDINKSNKYYNRFENNLITGVNSQNGLIFNCDTHHTTHKNNSNNNLINFNLARIIIRIQDPTLHTFLW